MDISIEFEREDDGRWIAEIPSLPGVMAYGESRDIAARRAGALALRRIAERLENGEVSASFNPVAFTLSFCEPLAVNYSNF